MIYIDIEIPRPFQTFVLVSAIVGISCWSGGAMTSAIGGSGMVQAQVVRDAEQQVKQLREEQDVLDRRENILRAELDALEQEERYNNDPVVQAELARTRESLIGLIQDQRKAEQEILVSLKQIWEAQGYAVQASHATGIAADSIELSWPVEPSLGISAHFEDDAYEKKFGMPHHAIDIPALQGTVIGAAADGVVAKVSDNGMGFSSLVIKHEGGFATMYGHVSAFLVKEGQRVYAGDPVALSGGRPGTPGAGRMTTGAHVHLEVLKDGVQVDPLLYLPQ